MLSLINKVFLRNPKRNIPEGNNIISPAHGKIVRILDNKNLPLTIKKGIIGKIHLLTKDIAPQCWVICIMMNIHNIHVQRSPIAGKVLSQKHSRGKFLNAVFGAEDMLWIENEKNEIILQQSGLKLKVVQVAGLMATRIVSYIKPGQTLKKGQDLGHIALGSQVILIIPKKKNIKIVVEEQQSVIDGETIIASL